MPDWLKFPVVLTIVSIISAASLAGLWAVTLPEKERIQAAITEKSLNVVLPEANFFVEKEATAGGKRIEYREALKDGEVIGYAAEGEGTGYSSIVRVMVGVDKDLNIQGIEVLSQKETPGLGDQVMAIKSKKTWWTVITGTSPDESQLRPWFQEQFNGKNAPVAVQKDGGKIEAITGATISSRAVCHAVNQAVEDIKSAVKSN